MLARRKRQRDFSYGDIGAAVAAALSDREARSATILADPTHGRLREPLLKVLHFARAMELSPAGGREVSLEGMDQKIGQMAHEAPSVFSYYLPDYSPQGAVGDRGLVAPEAQVLTGTQMIGLLNGLHSLIDHGLSRCASGFGGETGSCQWPAAGGLAFAPADDDAAAAVAELDVLLTEGRLSAGSRAVVEAAYGAATNPAAALRAAQERMVLAPEFHATNAHEPGAPRDSSKYEKPSSAKFKAVVMLFLNGAVDSYTMLVPHSQCDNSNRLAREYREYRGPVADMPFDVTDVRQVRHQEGEELQEEGQLQGQGHGSLSRDVRRVRPVSLCNRMYCGCFLGGVSLRASRCDLQRRGAVRSGSIRDLAILYRKASKLVDTAAASARVAVSWAHAEIPRRRSSRCHRRTTASPWADARWSCSSRRRPP